MSERSSDFLPRTSSIAISRYLPERVRKDCRGRFHEWQSFREKFHWIWTRNRSHHKALSSFSLCLDFVSSLSLYREVLKCSTAKVYLLEVDYRDSEFVVRKERIPASHDSLSISRLLRYRSPCHCAFLSSSRHSPTYDANTGIRITSRMNNWSLLEN